MIRHLIDLVPPALLPACLCLAPPVGAQDFGLDPTGFADVPLLFQTGFQHFVDGVPIDELAVDARGEWVLVSGHDVVHSKGFPANAVKWIEIFLSKALEIDAVAVSPQGGWIVVAEGWVRTEGFLSHGDLLLEKIGERLKAGQRITELAMDGDGSGWMVTSTGNWAWAKSVPQGLFDALVDRHASEREVRVISISPDDSWILVADDWFASSGVTSACLKSVRTFQREVASIDHVGLAPDGGFFAFSNGSFAVDPTASTHAVEYGIVYNDAAGNPQTTNLWDRMDMLGISGVSIALIQDWRVQWARGYGTLQKYEQPPVLATTPFDCASVSKHVTSLGMMTLVEDPGVDLQLDTSVTDIVAAQGWASPLTWWVDLGPGFKSTPLPADDITLRRTLCHSASLDPRNPIYYDPDDPVPPTLNMLFGAEFDDEGNQTLGGDDMPWWDQTDGPPGTMYEYSAGGYLVAYAMAESMGGAPFVDLMQQRVLGPLGMDDSSFVQPPPASLAPRMAVPHDSSHEPVAEEDRDIYYWTASGGLTASAQDVAQVVITLMQFGMTPSGQVLISAAGAQTMMVDQTPDGSNYGLGVRLDGTIGPGQNGYFWHNGSHSKGARAQMAGKPATGEGLVILINAGSSEATRLRTEISTAFQTFYGW